MVADPPEPPPEGLRRVLKFRRLQGPAWQTVRRIVDTDDPFRHRVAETADEEELGHAAWIWLTRPSGWADELRELVESARTDARRGSEEHEIAQLRKALASTEEAARRQESAAERANDASLRARAELAEERTMRREAERALASAEVTAERAGEDRTVALGTVETQQSEVEQVRAELRVVRAALHEAEAELRSARPSAAPSVPVEELSRRIAEAASTASELSQSLAEVADELTEAAPSAPSPPSPEMSSPRIRGRRSRRPPPVRSGQRSRRPAPMPPGVWDDSPEAAAHLMRLRGVVVLVDGYNVARTAWIGLTPEEERSRLIAALEELHARTGAEVTVVFDGVQEGAPMSGPVSRTVRVRFTAAGVSADDDVRDLVERFPLQRPVVVVSSDREVAEGARARGANAVSSRQFLTALHR